MVHVVCGSILYLSTFLCDFSQSVVCDFCRAPDGTCLLVASADCKIRLYNLPSELYLGPIDHQLPEMVNTCITVTL